MPIRKHIAFYQQGYSVFVGKKYVVGYYGFVDSVPNSDYSFVIYEGTERLEFTFL